MSRHQPVPGNRWDLLDPDRDPGAGGRASVSVVVTHYEQPAQLARTLWALRRQTEAPEEIVVADDGSRDVPDAVALNADLHGPRVHVVTQPDRGFRAGAARNLGARSCHGDILVFLDADTTPEPDLVRTLTRRVAVSRDVVAVGRRRHADLRGLPPGADPAGAPALAEPAWLADGYAETGDLLEADGRSFRFLISAVMACRRDLFAELGGFDERFVGYGGEDWDLGFRAWNAGAVLVHEAGAVAWHDGPAAGGQAAPGSALEAQAIRLARLVPEPSFRGTPMPAELPDLLVDVEPGMATAAVVRCVHSLLGQDFRDLRVRLPPGVDATVAELYGPNVVTAPWNDDQLRRARARLAVRRALPRPAVARAMDVLVGQDAGRVLLLSGGEPAGTLTSTRAAARARRWSDHLGGTDSISWFFGTRQLEVGQPPAAFEDLAGFFAGGGAGNGYQGSGPGSGPGPSHA